MSMLTILSWGGWTSEAEAALGPGILDNHHEFTIENPSLYVFYEEAMTGYEGDIFDIMVSVDNERYHELSSIYQALSDERAYEIILDSSNNSFITKLGNGIYGYLPKDQSIGYIRLRTTLGVNGHILKEKALDL